MGSELFPRQSGCAGHWSHRIVRHSWAMPRFAVHRSLEILLSRDKLPDSQQRATSLNLSQTTTALVVTARGYSCKPDLHRRKKNNLGKLTSKGVIKPEGNLHYCKKIKGGHRGELLSYCPWDFYQNSPRPKQSLGQEERKAAEILLSLHTGPLDFPQTAPTWQTLHREGFKETTRREMPVSMELASESSQCSFQQTSQKQGDWEEREGRPGS